ncbi:hypothetical protein DLAC_09156 [Tieghemostelium lacteum]|uniref:Uncharacterized protein n=1 Tax=Tieghemostelium lacteum TaxID=361077 RepID=A0A151Z9A2_TIELA|nr:hypothetical protein DLAC_09156 [Tieghemostelium lacteum]|eukprot:KYQ90531.1 hypothetical protein DLAC_09156 [Tieghemostelium lacteum]
MDTQQKEKRIKKIPIGGTKNTLNNIRKRRIKKDNIKNKFKELDEFLLNNYEFIPLNQEDSTTKIDTDTLMESDSFLKVCQLHYEGLEMKHLVSRVNLVFNEPNKKKNPDGVKTKSMYTTPENKRYFCLTKKENVDNKDDDNSN